MKNVNFSGKGSNHFEIFNLDFAFRNEALRISQRLKLLHCFLLMLLTTGLWPFNFWQLNQANGGNSDGLHIAPPATVYTPFPVPKLLNLREFTIALHLSSDFLDSNGYARILSYSMDNERINFMIGQWEDSIVFKLRALGIPSPIHFETEGILKKGEKGWVIIVFDGEKLLLYHNGEIKNEKMTGPLIFSSWNGSYPLVIGSEADGKFPWKGSLYSITIFDRPFSPEEVTDFPLSMNSGQRSDTPLIDYSFNGGGSEIRDRGTGQPADLLIPGRFEPFKRKFLEKPNSLEEIRNNFWDIFLNFLAFIPLGFLLSEYFTRWHRSLRGALLLSLIIGFSISLAIEILQVLLPTRHSSMSDLITNTFGTGIGSIIFLQCGNFKDAGKIGEASEARSKRR